MNSSFRPCSGWAAGGVYGSTLGTVDLSMQARGLSCHLFVNTVMADTLGQSTSHVVGIPLSIEHRVFGMPVGHVSGGGRWSGSLKAWSMPAAWHHGDVPGWLRKMGSERKETPLKRLSSLPGPCGPPLVPLLQLTLLLPLGCESGGDGWAEPIHGLPGTP